MGIHRQEAKNQGQEPEQLSETDVVLSSLSLSFSLLCLPLHLSFLTSAPLLSLS